MRLSKLRRITMSLLAVCLLGTSVIAVSADNLVELSDGSVVGINKGLYVMDEEGNSASESGELYVSIEDMKPCVTYTKTLSLQNFVTDTYTLTMAAEPVSKSGNLDLEENTNVKIYLEDEEIYDGKVTGEGNVSMTDGNVLDLGEIESGKGKELKIELYWDGSGFEDIEGDSYEGEVQFKWIFEAIMKEEAETTITTTSNNETVATTATVQTNSSGSSGTSASNESVVNTGSQMFTVAIAVLFLVLLVLAFLAIFSRFKKINDDEDNKDDEDNGGDDNEQK